MMTKQLSLKFNNIKSNFLPYLLFATLSFPLASSAFSAPSNAEAVIKSTNNTAAQPLIALSETKVPIIAPGSAGQEKTINPEAQIPLPGPLRQVPTQTFHPNDYTIENDEIERDITRPHITSSEEVPEVFYDITKLPQAVQDTRLKIIEAAKSGNIEAVRPLLGTGEDTTLLSLGDYEGTPLEYLKSLSGDNKGQEILAIMIDLLNAGYVRLDAGTPNELYVWPYFFAYPIEQLNDRQMVELYQIITAGDFEEMKQVGAYVFYRLGISPDGHWRFLVAGD